MPESNVRRQNEVIVFIPEDSYTEDLQGAIKTSGTAFISVDHVRGFRTPFGNYMIIAIMSTVRANGSTYDLRQYTASVLTRAGYAISKEEVIAPGKMKKFRVTA